MKLLDWLYEKLNPLGDDFFGEAAKAQLEEAKRHEETARSMGVLTGIPRPTPGRLLLTPSGFVCPVCARKRAQAKERMRRVRARKREEKKEDGF